MNIKTNAIMFEIIVSIYGKWEHNTSQTRATSYSEVNGAHVRWAAAASVWQHIKFDKTNYKSNRTFYIDLHNQFFLSVPFP